MPGLETSGARTFFKVSEFATEGTLHAPDSTRPIIGIYDSDYLVARFGRGSEVETKYHSLYVMDREAVGVRKGYTLTINSLVFTISRIEPDSGGMTWLILTPVIDLDAD